MTDLAELKANAERNAVWWRARGEIADAILWETIVSAATGLLRLAALRTAKATAKAKP